MPRLPIRVLLVEDEPVIGMLIEDALIETGCSVSGIAYTMKTGLALVDGAPFDAAVLDVNLAGQMSFPIAVELQRRGVPFIFVTGYSGTSVNDKFPGVPVLSKPIVPAEIRAALAHVTGLPA